MNDTFLGETLGLILETLTAREAQTKAAKGNHREISWYIDGIRSAIRRINDLERDAGDTLTTRDTIALQILPGVTGFDDYGQACAYALARADEFLEARKAPRDQPTFGVDTTRYQYRKAGGLRVWHDIDEAAFDQISRRGYDVRIIPAGIVEPIYQYRLKMHRGGDEWGDWRNCEYGEFAKLPSKYKSHDFDTRCIEGTV